MSVDSVTLIVKDVLNHIHEADAAGGCASARAVPPLPVTPISERRGQQLPTFSIDDVRNVDANAF